MLDSPHISLIVPTRQRVAQLNAFLKSIIETAAKPKHIELILVIDDDDSKSQQISSKDLSIQQVIVPRGLTMGALNTAGYNASRGRYVMLLNDDVICRTPGWDAKMLACFGACPDDILLVHVNDTLMQTALCTFPAVSRTFCDIAGGICPTEYIRYRIDDHIEDIFNLLGVLGAYRSVYLPDVVFEHQNYEERTSGLRQYFSDNRVLAQDAPTFERLMSSRKKIALHLRSLIEKRPTPTQKQCWFQRIDRITDSFSLRVPKRLRVMRSFSPRDIQELGRRLRRQSSAAHVSDTWKDIVLQKLDATRDCYRQTGVLGVAQLLCRKTYQLGRGLVARSQS